MNYNETQKRAVSHKDGPMLVLAGPGSGKTSVITGRTVRMIEDGISPSSILVVTFTRAAAAEMKERFLHMTGQRSTQVTFGTFHGVFYAILKQAFHINGSNILDDDTRLQLIREILSHTHRDAEREADLPSQVSRELSQVRSGFMNPENFYSVVLPQDEFRVVYREFEKWKQENRKIDFDDIIIKCYQLLRARADIRKRWQEKFRYILVDEFQDISPLQYRIIRILAEPEQNLFIVGDDDQSIYRFRGASPDIMLHFPKDYPNCEVIALETNYRSTPNILAASEKLIQNNVKRYQKQIKAANPIGEDVLLEVYDNARSECEALAKEVRAAHDAGVPYHEIAVLVRTNTGCRAAVEQMMAYQIPFRVADVIPCIFDHWIARDIFTYLELGAGSRKRSDFLKIYNRPNRYFSREAFYEPVLSFENLYIYYEDKDWMCRRVEQFETDIKMIGHLAPYGAVQYIRREIGYDGYIAEYAAEHGIPRDELNQVLDELTESARNYPTYEKWLDSIAEYREKLEAKQNRQETEDGVIISTLHASKGLEFDRVYILDVNEGVIPYQKAVLDADLEEERRMLYVGMTRARKKLKLCAVRERYEKKQELSHFIKEVFHE